MKLAGKESSGHPFPWNTKWDGNGYKGDLGVGAMVRLGLMGEEVAWLMR